MRKLSIGLVLVLAAVMAIGLNSCSKKREQVIKVGINAPITGDIPKVGEGSKFAAQMWLADIEKAGGLDVEAQNIRLRSSSKTMSPKQSQRSRPIPK